MKTSIRFFIFLLAVNYAWADNGKVLFIGNSYVYSNNLPQVFYQLGLAAGDTFTVDLSAPGGYTFNQHTSNATTLSKINAQDWDYVILQEQSQMPSFPPSQVETDVYPYARILDSLVRLNYNCTQTLFFMTWGRKYGDVNNCPNYPPLCTYAGMQQRLRESYLQMASDNLAMVAPVGMAFARSMQLDSTINLYSADNSHPSLAGTYLAACVFYTSISQQSPVGINYTAGLSSATAQFLQQVAGNVVLDSLAVWRQPAMVPDAAFTYSLSGSTITLTQQSQNAKNYFWDFGDSNTSTLSNPAHTFSAPGTYSIQLIAENRCLADTLQLSITIQPTGIETESLQDLLLSEVDGQLTISNNSPYNAELAVYDICGRTIGLLKVESGRSQQFNLPSKGAYILKENNSPVGRFKPGLKILSR